MLLRIQEENVDRNNETIRESAFCALIHFIQHSSHASSPDRRQIIIPKHISPTSLDAHILRGLQDWNPPSDDDFVDLSDSPRKHGVSEAFLGSLLEWDHLSPERQKPLLADLPLESFLCSYIVAIHWSNEELGQWDHRVRYRRILTNKVRTQLDDVIGRYPEKDLLSKLAPFIEQLDKKIPSDAERPEQSKKACEAMMGILRRIRVNNKLPESSPMLALGPLASLFPPVETHIPQPPHSPGGLLLPVTLIDESPVPKPILEMKDLITLRHREALVFYIEKFACKESYRHAAVIQFLADCNRLLELRNPEPKVARRNKTSSHDLNNKLSQITMRGALNKDQQKEVSKLFDRMSVHLKSALDKVIGKRIQAISNISDAQDMLVNLPPASWEKDVSEPASPPIDESPVILFPPYAMDIRLARNGKRSFSNF